VGNHPKWGKGLGFYLDSPNLEVGKWFLLGGGVVKKHKKSFFKFTPLIWAIEGQNNKSYRGDLDLQKKKTISNFFKNSQLRGEKGLERFGWFPTFYRFLVLKAYF